MKREEQLRKKIAFIQKHGEGMTADDLGNRVALIANEFEDLLPTYKGVKDDAVSRFWEFAKRLGEPAVEEPMIAPTEEVVEKEEVVVVVEEEKPVVTPKPKTPRKPRAKKAPAAE